MTRRSLALLCVLLVLPAVPATADDDLHDYLEQASDADFFGRGLIFSRWGVEDAAVMYDVTRHDGMSMSHGPDGDLMVTPTLVAMRSGTDWYAIESPERARWELSDRYSFGEPEPTLRLGRPATEYVVFEGDEPRVRLVVDDASTVPLLTEILTDGGEVFRLAALLEIDDTPDPMSDMPDPGETHQMTPAAPSPRLPASTAGYALLDTYEVPGAGTQSYYGDGLFSFSIFETKRGSTPDAFDRATRWVVDGVPYLRLVTPSQVWVQWHAPDRSYIVVGDLPPDHLEQVLPDLPMPGNRGFFTRLWRRIFG